MKFTRRFGLFMAWLIAMAATFGSLYYSEIQKLDPCNLCWYQRICVYPLAIILGIAAYRGDRKIALYGVPLAAVGLGLSLYQILEQHIPALAVINLCGSGPDCGIDHLHYFGFLTMPMMSAAAFTAILFFLIRSKKWDDLL